MANNKKIDESEMLSRLAEGNTLLSPLVITQCSELGKQDKADARIQTKLPGEQENFEFAVEIKATSTPLAVSQAVAQAKAWPTTPKQQPLVFVPYLSPERLEELENEKVSGVDLCGNGVIIVPGRLYVLRTGNPNKYRDSRPLNNPYRGRSAMVARMLLTRTNWGSLGELQSAIAEAGGKLSLSQTSKAVQSIHDDRIVSKKEGAITLQEPSKLLDKLGNEWRKPSIRERQALKLPPGTDPAKVLSTNPLLKWALTGASSVRRYAMFSQGGPPQFAVSSLPLAQTLLKAELQHIPNFADIELVETHDAGVFFANEVDDNGLRWASKLQTWLELQSGDGRQKEAAKELRTLILREIAP